MKAVTLPRFGGPEVLTLAEVPDPVPAPAKRLEVGYKTTAFVEKRDLDQSIVIDDAKQAESKFATNAHEKRRFKNIVSNINFKHTFDSTGKEITADADYGVFNSLNLSNFVTGFYSLNNEPIRDEYKLNGDQGGKISLFTIKADYTHPLKNGAKIEAGFKTSFVETDNDVVFHNVFLHSHR